MFFVNGMSKSMMRGSTSSVIDLRFKILAVMTFLVITGLAAALDWNVVTKINIFNEIPNPHQIRFLLAMRGFECIYFGMSMTFMIFGAVLVHKVASSMKTKVLIIYLSIVWLLVSWYPHIHAHQFWAGIWAIIVIDFLFHMTSAFVGVLLSYCIIRIMKSATATKIRPFTGWGLMELLKADIVQFLLISVILGFVAFGFGQYIPSTKQPVSRAEVVLLNVLFFGESCFLGSAFAFVVFAAPLIKKMSSTWIKFKSIILTITLWWTLASWYPHLRMHIQDDPKGLFKPSYFIMIEGVFHLSVMVCSILLAWVTGNLILLSVSLSNSPFQENVEASRSRNNNSKSNNSKSSKSPGNTVNTDSYSVNESEMVDITTHVFEGEKPKEQQQNVDEPSPV